MERLDMIRNWTENRQEVENSQVESRIRKPRYSRVSKRVVK